MKRVVRQGMVCQTKLVQLAEVPLAPKEPERHSKLRLTTVAGTLEIMDADQQTPELVLRGTPC